MLFSDYVENLNRIFSGNVHQPRSMDVGRRKEKGTSLLVNLVMTDPLVGTTVLHEIIGSPSRSLELITCR